MFFNLFVGKSLQRARFPAQSCAFFSQQPILFHLSNKVQQIYFFFTKPAEIHASQTAFIILFETGRS
ncbi:hypothetical protein C7120_11115 [Prevotella sp. oral taxon 376]|nr:hypothetical protein C7120_11115 [Prevotella sp. oral taxon 376]